jgi:hypothetical protein
MLNVKDNWIKGIADVTLIEIGIKSEKPYTSTS